jgi:CelD/BcsL family acetyltransferase involved in cellulose biosynthesis
LGADAGHIVRARIHSLDSLSDREIAAWRALADTAAEPNPFFEPDFVLPAARHLASRDVGLLAVENGDGWSACMPVAPMRVGGFSPGVGTWRHQYCFLGTPLVDRDRLEPAIGTLLRHPLGKGPAPLFMAEAMSDGPVLGALHHCLAEEKLAIVFEADHERASLHRRSDGVYSEGKRAHRRRELQRLWRRLEEDLGEELEVEESTGERPVWEDFLELESSGWKGRNATALAADPSHATFFRELCASFAEAGRLQMLTLKAGKRIVAMKCNISAGDTLFCFKIGYDESLSRFSPGVQLERANVDVFHERRDEEFMDSCAAPDNKMINRLWPDRRTIANLVLGRNGARGAVARQALRAVNAARTARSRRTASTSS